jgi:hypothetical protein
MSLMLEIVKLIWKEINALNPNVSSIILATIITIARVEVSLYATHKHCYTIAHPWKHANINS